MSKIPIAPADISGDDKSTIKLNDKLNDWTRIAELPGPVTMHEHLKNYNLIGAWNTLMELKKPNGDIIYCFRRDIISTIDCSNDWNTATKWVFRVQCGLTVIKTYYSTGELESTCPYVDGERHGVHQGFYKNKSVQFEYEYNHGKSHGVHVSYNENGDLFRVNNYYNDRLDGESKEYSYSTGLLESITVYKSGVRSRTYK